MRVRYTRNALAHLVEIRAFTEREKLGSAKQVGQSIRITIARLSQYPELGRQGRVAGSREIVVPRLPFIVAYRIKEGHIDVLAILHGSRKWPSEFEGK